MRSMRSNPGRSLALWIFVAALVSLTTLNAGCGSTSKRITLAAPTAFSAGLDIENPFGPVTVRVDPRAEHISTRVTKELRRGSRATKSALKDVQVVAETQQPVEDKLVTSIVARGAGLTDDIRVTLVVTTPRCDGVRVRARGDIVMAGVSGAIQAESQSGAIDVRTNHPLRDPVALTTGAGNVYLTASPQSRGRIEAHATNGRARVHSAETPLRNITAGDSSYTADLHGGENVILLRSDDGDVYLHLVDDPMSYVRTFR